jgi:hypothetical protein
MSERSRIPSPDHSMDTKRRSVYARMLTTQKHLELLVIELSFPVGHQGTLRTLPHRVHEAHAPKWHLLAAAPITEALPTSATVVLERAEGRR